MNTSYIKNGRQNRDGAMLPYVAMVIVVLFIAAVFAIDIARIHVVRSELRTATDAAAKAAVEALGREQSTAAAIDAALRVAEENVVAGVGLQLDPSNIVFGTSGQGTDGTFSFNQGGSILNAVRVTGERTANSPQGPVGLFFAGVIGQREFQPVQSATATRLDRDIALVLDVSGSMSTNGRFQGLQNALDVFLNELDQTSQRERLSLTVYSTQERKRVDLTENLQLIRDAFAEESPGGFTAIGQGLESGLDSIVNDAGARPFALKSVIVMTDGRQNRGVSPDIVVRDAQGAGVTVHTITFSAGANQALMADVADIGGGIHLHAEDDDELLEAFQTIAKQLQVLLIE
jgi:Mg-chelatase subunit ChlD